MNVTENTIRDLIKVVKDKIKLIVNDNTISSESTLSSFNINNKFNQIENLNTRTNDDFGDLSNLVNNTITSISKMEDKLNNQYLENILVNGVLTVVGNRIQVYEVNGNFTVKLPIVDKGTIIKVIINAKMDSPIFFDCNNIRFLTNSNNMILTRGLHELEFIFINNTLGWTFKLYSYMG